MARHLLGDTPEILQRLREEVLATDAEDFRGLGDALEAAAKRGRIVVLGSDAAIRAANEARPGFLRYRKALWSPTARLGTAPSVQLEAAPSSTAGARGAGRGRFQLAHQQVDHRRRIERQNLR